MSLKARPHDKRIYVFLVEQHNLAKRHLEVILSGERSFRTAQIELENLRTLRKPISGVLLLSHLHLSSLPGYVKDIRRSSNEAKILVVSSRSRPITLLSLLRSGAHGFLSDDEVDTDLVLAVRTVAEGRIWLRAKHFLPNAIAHQSAEDDTFRATGKFTVQQNRVIELVRENLSNKQIASELGISERTVKFHLQNVFLKLGVNNRYAIRDLQSSLSTWTA